MRLRSYASADFEALYAVEKLCFNPQHRFSRPTMRRLLTAQRSATWIAECDGELAGFAIVEWMDEIRGVSAYIDTLEVAPAFRRRGFGAALLAAVEDSSRRVGAYGVWLHVAIDNVSAIQLYERHGFEYVASQDHFYAEGLGAHIYRRMLMK
jgi:ribosomal-protein-alanine N-acetyltransferase